MTRDDALALWQRETGVVLDQAGQDKLYSAVAEMAKRRLAAQAPKAAPAQPVKAKRKRGRR